MVGSTTDSDPPAISPDYSKVVPLAEVLKVDDVLDLDPVVLSSFDVDILALNIAPFPSFYSFPVPTYPKASEPADTSPEILLARLRFYDTTPYTPGVSGTASTEDSKLVRDCPI